MKHYNCVLLFGILMVVSSCGFGTAGSGSGSKKNNQPTWQWEQTDKSLTLLNGENRVLWKLNFDSEQDKPYFHPLRTPKGYNLTLERPKDHPWHRGLWFSWKDINGVNYWEEDPEIGVAEGRSIIKAVSIEKLKNFSAKIILNISYEEKGVPQITEKRVIEISSPQDREEYTIQFHQSFEILEDLRLYLEKPAKHGGVEWGGYAGLSFRASDSLVNHQFTTSSGWVNSDNITGYGEKERWMDMTAKVMGSQEYVGLTIFDSPDNPRFPSPYYVWFAKGEHAFFTPSLLFDGPMDLKKGESLLLNYLVLVHDGKKSNEQLSQFEKF
ncbi:PmoA family protein [Arenibacter sp. ARW7G5Y1]|uniref:DUF6807 domain-containing protein n=1 Tax=Arenibacter sp. ARW7G5Y1 TaxID=2135619 RepID=UPI000D762805|nr:PmoA family protein [Arenibacter sp. ARW7G5Y1]PXX30389.1 methane monooxygenase PmoA-like [Arenibacter sp. ARW7G5Y1]